MGRLALTHKVNEGVRVTGPANGATAECFVRLLSITPNPRQIALEVTIAGCPEQIFLEPGHSAQVLSHLEIKYVEHRKNQEARVRYIAPNEYKIRRGEFVDGVFSDQPEPRLTQSDSLSDCLPTRRYVVQ